MERYFGVILKFSKVAALLRLSLSLFSPFLGYLKQVEH